MAGLYGLLGLAALVTGGGIRGLVIPVYFLGSIALGALSMGHEYSGGTLTLLLSQPRRREYLFLLKMGVLALLLLVLSAVARIALFSAPGPDGLPAVLAWAPSTGRFSLSWSRCCAACSSLRG